MLKKAFLKHQDQRLIIAYQKEWAPPPTSQFTAFIPFSAPHSSSKSPTPSLQLHNFQSSSCTLIYFQPYDFLYPS
uniref:Uncharacterized protein n=1 Tax=Timema bartmani TaxID=61472 RepID=A0A7R9HX49_9NEOP|nr:unnamed protein product [Timema bartmani]